MPWNRRDALRTKINRAIDRRMATGGVSSLATKKQLRNTLTHAYHRDTYEWACRLKGVTLWGATADELFDILYGLAWARAWGRPLQEYFATNWGAEEQLPGLAA